MLTVDEPTGRLSFGTFVVEVDSDGEVSRFSGSDDLATVLGFTPGEVLFTAVMLSAHVHAVDRVAWQTALQRCLTTGEAVVVGHRLITADRSERTATTTFAAGPTIGRTRTVTGVVTDLTNRLRAATDSEITQAVRASAATRSQIDQAKGMIMAAYDLDAEQAFDLLKWHSSHTNRKLRDLGAALVEGWAVADPGMPLRQRVSAVFQGLGSPAPSTEGWSAPSAETGSSPTSGLIPQALLPGILTRATHEASVAITVADILAEDQPLVYVNPAFERLTGYSAEEVLGRNCRFLQGPYGDPRLRHEIREAIVAGRSVDTLIRNIKRNGAEFWNEFHLSPVRNKAGRLTHYIGYQLDVTERVERDQQLSRLTDLRLA